MIELKPIKFANDFNRLSMLVGAWDKLVPVIEICWHSIFTLNQVKYDYDFVTGIERMFIHSQLKTKYCLVNLLFDTLYKHPRHVFSL